MTFSRRRRWIVGGRHAGQTCDVLRYVAPDMADVELRDGSTKRVWVVDLSRFR